MRLPFILLSLFMCSALAAQQKGLQPAPAAEKQEGVHYGVVVGVSEYLDQSITDLHFADKDAEAFAEYLRSPAGGSLDDDHLKVLTNEAATQAEVVMALYWLIDVVQENETIAIYFSGHGDVESKRVSQPGYLLCHNANAKAYMIGGAIKLQDLQDIITTLSVENKARIILVTDACRSGNLAGDAVNGKQVVGQNLAAKIGNEIKILSCQPEENSLEGTQWGGGRGVFSYHLLRGLYGLADKNNDQQVTLSEIGRYLEDQVIEDVDPDLQTPMTVGNPREKITTVVPDLLSQLSTNDAVPRDLLASRSTNAKGIRSTPNESWSASTQKNYDRFQETLKEGQYFEPDAACTDRYFQQLIRDTTLKSWHPEIRRSYAAALLDDVQADMRSILSTGQFMNPAVNSMQNDIYQMNAERLSRAGQILGPDNVLYRSIQANKLFFKGLTHADRGMRQSTISAGLIWEPDMPHLMTAIIPTFSADMADSAKYYTDEAASLTTTWALPYLTMAQYYQDTLQDLQGAEAMLKKAEQAEPDSEQVDYAQAHLLTRQGRHEEARQKWMSLLRSKSPATCMPCIENRIGHSYLLEGRTQEAATHIQNSIDGDPENLSAYINLGIIYTQSGDWMKAESKFQEVLDLDSLSLVTDPILYSSWLTHRGWLRYQQGQFANASSDFQSLIVLEPNNGPAHSKLASAQIRNERYAEASDAVERALQLSPLSAQAHYNKSLLEGQAARLESAFAHLENALRLGWTDLNALIQAPELTLLRADGRRWQALIKQFTPSR